MCEGGEPDRKKKKTDCDQTENIVKPWERESASGEQVVFKAQAWNLTAACKVSDFGVLDAD